MRARRWLTALAVLALAGVIVVPAAAQDDEPDDTVEERSGLLVYDDETGAFSLAGVEVDLPPRWWLEDQEDWDDVVALAGTPVTAQVVPDADGGAASVYGIEGHTWRDAGESPPPWAGGPRWSGEDGPPFGPGADRGRGLGRPDHAGEPGPPDHAGRPDGAGPPDHASEPGPPEHANRPDGVGPPDHASEPGPPEHANRPDGAGPPDHAGRPDGVGPPNRGGNGD